MPSASFNCCWPSSMIGQSTCSMRSGHVATWNLAAARLIGFASEHIIGREFAVLFSETDRQAGIPDQMLAEAARSGRHVRQIERSRPDGSRFTSSVSVQRVDEPAGILGGFAVIEHDLTLRQQLAARETAARLFEDYPDAVLTVDQTGQIMHANARAPEMFGYDREDAARGTNRTAGTPSVPHGARAPARECRGQPTASPVRNRP